MIIQQTWKQCDYIRDRSSFVSSNSHVSINSVSNVDVINNENDESSDKNKKLESAKSLEILQKIKKMMNRFMIRDNHSSMQWMLNLRTYELKIHYNTTIENHVDWVDDQVLYKQIQFSMIDFRDMMHELIERTKELLMNELLFRKNEVIDAISLSRFS